MKIVVNELKKCLELIKNDGTVIDSCSYKALVNNTYTIEDLKKENDEFNKTLSSFDDFDDIKDLAEVLKVHNWD